MQTTTAIFMCILGVCLFSEGMSRCHRFDNPNSDDTVPADTRLSINCTEYLCHKDGSWSGKICPLSFCQNQIGETPTDYSKDYPECCPRPICG